MLDVAKIIKSKILKLLYVIKFQLLTLWYAFKDPECPIYLRATIFIVICYGFSPIDLIPDFIPVIGYVDELIILPIFIKIVEVLMPGNVSTRAKAKASSHLENKKPKPRVWVGIVMILGIWLLVVTSLVHLLAPKLLDYVNLHH